LVLTGTGTPRTFFLRSYFVIDDIEPGIEDGVQTRLSGSGQGFDPMLILNDEDWFDDFKTTQGNFALGFQHIADQRFIDGLLAVADRS
jgi:hypothetical protein